MRFEKLDDSIDSLDAPRSVECRKYEMSCLCEIQGSIDRFCITHFTDHHDIRIFTHRRTDRCHERQCITSHFPLRKYALFRCENKFDRIFDRNDVFRTRSIDLFDERHHGRRFSASSWSCYEKESLFYLEHFLYTGREDEFFEAFCISFYAPYRHSRLPHF